jgi:hypothetical protein
MCFIILAHQEFVQNKGLTKNLGCVPENDRSMPYAPLCFESQNVRLSTDAVVVTVRLAV